MGINGRPPNPRPTCAADGSKHSPRIHGRYPPIHFWQCGQWKRICHDYGALLMAGGITISGISDVNAILSQIPPREGINLIRATVHDIALQLARSGKDNSPDDPSTGAGDLKSSIKAKKRRGTRTTVNSDVIVLASAYYWKFLEYGDGPDNVEHAMFLKALQAMRPDMNRVYLEAFAKKLIARMKRARKKAG
jgi:hypothetical protein